MSVALTLRASHHRTSAPASRPDQARAHAVPEVAGAAYRQDIDWLRAIAVLAVVAFHFETPGIYGGFVGVDIFFVISGYLITGIIHAEVREGRFSFTTFYERRLRRLLPALYVMVALTAIPSFHFLLTSERTEFFRSVAAVVTFTSNIFFCLQSGYFDHAAVEKPLLHTWSLAVEEQFYLALPVLVWAVLRLAPKRRLALPLVIGALAVASFAFGQHLVGTDRSANAFYLSPPRAWEFLIGSLVALPGMPVLRGAWARAALRLIGLAAMFGAIMGLRAGSGFPGVNALGPCLGAALFIWSGVGAPTRQPRRAVVLDGFGFFGRISYSLYLWHWPLFTFARFAKASLVLGAADKAVLFLAATGISYLSWRFIEQPFRERALMPTRSSAFRLAAVSSCVLLLGSACSLLIRSAPEMDRAAARFDAYNDYDRREPYRAGHCFDAPGGIDDSCLQPVSGKTNVLLWGDSFAAHYVHGLAANIDPETVNVLQASHSTCMPTFNAAAQGTAACHDFDAQMRTWLASHRPDLVIMSADWLEYARGPRFAGMISDLEAVIAALQASGIPAVLLGPSVQFKSRLPSMLARASLRGIAPTADELVLPDIFALDLMMREALPAEEGFSYVSMLDAVCPDRQCPITVGDDVPLSFDHAHLTAEGSDYVMQRVVRLLGLFDVKVVPSRVGDAGPQRRLSRSDASTEDAVTR